MLRRRAAWRFIPAMDTLESRWVPDGNVSVALKHGVLSLIGDVAANQINIVGTGSGNITVSSLDGITTLNGATAELNFTKVKGLSVKMGDGNNVLTLTDLNIQKEFSLSTGAGADDVTIDESQFKSMTLNTGAGNDVIDLTGNTLSGKAGINTGAGADTLTLADTNFGKGLDISSNAGDDTITLDDVTSGGESRIDTHGGLDTLEISNTTFSKHMRIDTGGEADSVTLDNSTFSKEFKIDTGSGADTLLIDTVFALKETQVRTGSGDDSVTILDSTFSKEFHILAAGDDEILLSDSIFSKRVSIEGQSGDDLLVSTGNVFQKKMSVIGIETQTTKIDAPTATNDNVSLSEGGTAIINVAANDAAGAGTTLDLSSIVIVTQPVNGSVNVNGDGTITYIHSGSETTSDSFQYTIKNNLGTVSNVATVSVSVVAVNDAPIAAVDLFNVLQGSSTVLNILANDSDAEGTLNVSTVVITQQPAHGTLQINADGTVTYQHDNLTKTPDSFAYTVQDSSGLVSNIALVTLTIL